jgi:predicted RNase H-like nuclease
MIWIAGVDGFRSHWCAVLQNVSTGELRTRLVPTFAGLLELPERPEIICVDIPIGLPEFTMPGGRACEKEARRILGRRASPVFSAIGRLLLRASSRAEAHGLSRALGGVGVGAQAWGLAKKLRDADLAMTPEWQSRIREVHPEVCFWAMNRRIPMPFSKKSPEGASARIGVLISAGFSRAQIEKLLADSAAGRDDVLDALAGLWTAARVLTGQGERLPAALDLDARGLDQAIWF